MKFNTVQNSNEYRNLAKSQGVATVQPTSVLTKASVWYEIRVVWAKIWYFLQPYDLQECTVPHLKDLIHICLEIESQGHGIIFNMIYVCSKYPYFISYPLLKQKLAALYLIINQPSPNAVSKGRKTNHMEIQIKTLWLRNFHHQTRLVWEHE